MLWNLRRLRWFIGINDLNAISDRYYIFFKCHKILPGFVSVVKKSTRVEEDLKHHKRFQQIIDILRHINRNRWVQNVCGIFVWNLHDNRRQFALMLLAGWRKLFTFCILDWFMTRYTTELPQFKPLIGIKIC